MSLDQAQKILLKRQRGRWVGHALLKEACQVLGLDPDEFKGFMKALQKVGNGGRSIHAIATPMGGQPCYRR